MPVPKNGSLGYFGSYWQDEIASLFDAFERRVASEVPGAEVFYSDAFRWSCVSQYVRVPGTAHIQDRGASCVITVEKPGSYIDPHRLTLDLNTDNEQTAKSLEAGGYALDTISHGSESKSYRCKNSSPVSPESLRRIFEGRSEEALVYLKSLAQSATM